MKRFTILLSLTAVSLLLLVSLGSATPPPNPTDITATSGAYWVNHTWAEGVNGSGWHMISGESGGKFIGFNLSATSWVQDDIINNSLGDIGSFSHPEVFEIGGVWYMITGSSPGVFYGYDWVGDGWASGSSISTGLPDVGYNSAPAVFEMGGTLYMISGEGSGGGFYGFNWTGAAWQGDPAINNSLGNTVYNSAPTVFQMDGTWYLISGAQSTTLYGFKWTGSAWQTDSGIINGLNTPISKSSPYVFQMDGTWYLISGGTNGMFYGFNWTGSAWQTDTAVTGGMGDVGDDSVPTIFNMPPQGTDSYNISVNSVWHNDTTDAFWNASYSSPAWQNITVYAWADSLSDGYTRMNSTTTGLSPASWWDGDWDLRQRIDIVTTHAAHRIDSYVEVTINASQCYWGDCRDMRFIDAMTGNEIDFYCDADIGGYPNYTSSEIIYLKIPSFSAQNQAHIDFYFGNINSVPNECSGPGTLSFTEDFEDEDDFYDRWYPSGYWYGIEEYGANHYFTAVPTGTFSSPTPYARCNCAHCPCTGTNAKLKYGYYGDRYALVQPSGATIHFDYHAPTGGDHGATILFGCDPVGCGGSANPSMYRYDTWERETFAGYQGAWSDGGSHADRLNIEFSAWSGSGPLQTESSIDDISFQQNDAYMPPHALGAVETRPHPYIVLYDSSRNIVQHAQVTIQNTNTGEITERWKDVADGIIDMGVTDDTCQVAVRTFDGVFVHTCDLGANPVCEIVLPINYNLKVYPVDHYDAPLFDVFAGLAEYTPLTPQAFWGMDLSDQGYVPVTNCSGFAMCDIIAEKEGYVDYRVEALNWTSKSALVKDYRHNVVMEEE